MNTYDLCTKEGWLYAVGLAGNLGWRHGQENFKPLTAKELIRAVRANVNIPVVLAGHQRALRQAYGTAYWASTAAEEAAKREKHKTSVSAQADCPV